MTRLTISSAGRTIVGSSALGTRKLPSALCRRATLSVVKTQGGNDASTVGKRRLLNAFSDAQAAIPLDQYWS